MLPGNEETEPSRRGQWLFPSFRVFTYSTKVSGVTSLDTSSAHQCLFLFFFLEVEDPLTVRGGPAINSSQWAVNRGDECHFRAGAVGGPSFIPFYHSIKRDHAPDDLMQVMELPAAQDFE